MNIAKIAKAQYAAAQEGEPMSMIVDEWRDDDGKPAKVCWRPMNGHQQRAIQKQAEKSTAEGICMHIKLRAHDKHGDAIFKGTGLSEMMHTIDIEILHRIFFAMTGVEVSSEELEKN